ncbi:MAG TPA: ubiquitin-like domain-containing protein [Bacillota bacterium]|nr:ubiquitin-like domain-containing protein [Bacillota bacterium]
MRLFSKQFPALKSNLVISTVGVLALILFSGIVLFESTKAEVVVVDNGKEQEVKTHAKTVDEVLDEVGIAVGEHDALSHRADAKVEDGMQIDYKKAKQVFVTVDGQDKEYHTTLNTVDEFLAEHNLSFSKHDEISFNEDDKIKDGMHLEVTKAFQVTVDNGGEEKTYWTTGGTVQQLLKENDITYKKDSDDEIEPSLNEDVDEDTEITIVRVNKDTETKEKTIAFDTEEVEDRSLEKGEKRVISEGKDGKVEEVYEITRENGEEVTRDLVETKTVQDKKNRVVAVGTKEKASEPTPTPAPTQEPNITTVAHESNETTQENNQPTEETKQTNKPSTTSDQKSSEKSEQQTKDTSHSSGKELTMTASAYTASCEGCSGLTSTGIDLSKNPNKKVIAVDPSVIPLGSKVWVEGYGTAIAADTGGNIVGNRIDLHFPSKQAANGFGVKEVKVKILN